MITNKKNNNKKFYNFILQLILPFKTLLLLYLLIVIMVAINVSLTPLISKILLNKIINSNPSTVFSETKFLIIFLGILIMTPSILARISDYIWAMFLPKLRNKITQDSIKKLLEQSHVFFQNNFSGFLVNKVRDLFNSSPKLIEIFIQSFIGGSFAILFAFLTLTTINLFFALALMVWIMVIIPIAYRSARLTNRLSMNVANQQGRIMGNIVDVFANIQNIKLFSTVSYEIDRIDKLQKRFGSLYLKRGFFLNKNYTFLSLISSSYFIICFVALVWMYSRGMVTIGDFILIFGINNFLHNIVQEFMKQIRNFLEEISVVKEALEVVYKQSVIKDSIQKLEVTKGEIVYNNVDFSYHQKNPLFSDKTLVIKAGQKVGLVGHSGSGKSTFVSLLLRFYDVHDGEILIDGQDISKVSQDSLHDAIGVIPQEAILFHRNLIENISYGNKAVLSKKELINRVLDSSYKASAHKFISAMPRGYYSQVGERGVKLSGGQRQRIAIARAFFKNAPILVLDEATSNLDSITENMIQHSLENLMKNKTTLVIAHRLSTLKLMDRVLVFDQGKIVEDGTHEELLKLKGHYSKLWAAQSGEFLTYQIEGAVAKQVFPSN